MKVIGITGGIGAGKSTVLDYFEKELNAYVLKADLIGHLVMAPGGVCYQPVLELFGKKVLNEDKTIDRKQVSDVVFSHADKLAQLNKLIHPAVKNYILQKIEEERQSGRKLCIVEAALFFEDHYQTFCDEVWYVHTDKKIRIQRLMDTRGYTREKAMSIMDKQAEEKFFFDHTDYVILNNGDLKQTYEQINKGVNRT